MEIRPLQPQDRRNSFDSGDADLNRFFHLFAGQNQFKLHLGITYVAVEKEHIVAFVTVAAAHLEGDKLPAAMQKNLPRYPVPVLRLARLGVDLKHQGEKLGESMLRFVLELALKMADTYGCIGVLTDAKLSAVGFYSKYGFIGIDVEQGSADARPRPVPMYLPLKVVRSLSRKI